ncbi:hypothetical protein [Streptomyces sp. MP131-18]|uniref:hypothetical protein n=1 Tax=Streptomyces sp. MP131-18 TaxID=1857892 RepID=UPI00097CB018|nr:hypothetical protein [Streptomyces sp. MP131-18]ONK09458.1 hypothetical protein STBA_01580 [Streptomyces sp. MP131-18]
MKKTLLFGGSIREVDVRPIPTVCRTDHANDTLDREGCGGTGWICPACHQGDDCPTVGSDDCEPGTAGAQSCVCVDGQSGNWNPSTWS